MEEWKCAYGDDDRDNDHAYAGDSGDDSLDGAADSRDDSTLQRVRRRQFRRCSFMRIAKPMPRHSPCYVVMFLPSSVFSIEGCMRRLVMMELDDAERGGQLWSARYLLYLGLTMLPRFLLYPTV